MDFHSWYLEVSIVLAILGVCLIKKEKFFFPVPVKNGRSRRLEYKTFDKNHDKVLSLKIIEKHKILLNQKGHYGTE